MRLLFLRIILRNEAYVLDNLCQSDVETNYQVLLRPFGCIDINNFR